ncbi:PilZ domain-containing protein [Bradyrhizobium sp. LB13.1]
MEQNSSHSTRIPKSGSISFGRSKANCLIRSISEYGAALDVAGDEMIPDEFALTVIPDGGHTSLFSRLA